MGNVAGIVSPCCCADTRKDPAAKRARPPVPVGPGAVLNSAFVFVKPHAVTSAAVATVKERLAQRGILVTGEGDIASEAIDEHKLIDRHYYAIASKATILKPHELSVPKDKFRGAFQMDFDAALEKKLCLNAMDACQEFGCTADELNTAWGSCKSAGKLVKFGGGFYCGEITMKEKSRYVFNGFFMAMRSAFTAPGKSIHWFTVEWDPSSLSWADFRGRVLGPTDPKAAQPGSLRGDMLAQWKELGLPAEPNTGDNCVHASASPFEGLAERMNWLGKSCQEDPFGRALLAAGVDEATITAWSVDPQVVTDASGETGSLFDQLEDLDASDCIETAMALQELAEERGDG